MKPDLLRSNIICLLLVLVFFGARVSYAWGMDTDHSVHTAHIEAVDPANGDLDDTKHKQFVTPTPFVATCLHVLPLPDPAITILVHKTIQRIHPPTFFTLSIPSRASPA